MSEKKKELINKMEEVMKYDASFEEMAPKVKELKNAFVELVKVDHEKLKKEALENKEIDFKVPHDELDGRFSDMMAQFNQQKKIWEDQRAHEYGENLEIKKKILSDLDKLVQEEQHIGHAFEKLNTLKEKWKVTGPVPSSDYKEIQREYSHVIERFFYQINIYKTLKEYDLKKNLQLKLELSDKVKALIEMESLKEVRDLIGAYVREWDEIGPTYTDQWEKVRDGFWENVRMVHKRIADHFKDQKEGHKKNYILKEALCERAEKMSEEKLEDQRHWNRAVKQLNEVRDEWKKIGFAGKTKNDQIWKRFKTAVDAFYKSREGFQEEMKDVFKENEDRKAKLIESADAIKESVDWRGTAEAMKQLQLRWKNIGPASQGKEQKLWKKFRASTNHFFDARKEYFDGREDREKNNLKLKEELLKKLKTIKIEKGDEGVKTVKVLGDEWNAIGFVPKEAKSKVEEEYKKLLTTKLKATGKKEKEIDDDIFSMKVEGLKSADNSAELLRNEQQNLNEKLRKIETNIKQYENNLGFFGSNAESNPLLKEVLDKMEISKKEAEDLRNRIKLLR